MKSNARGLAAAAVIAAVYVILTIMPGFNLLSYGPVQFRVSEVLSVLPIFTSWAIPGVTMGCLIANILSTAGPLDMIFGTMATLLAAVSTYYMRKLPKFVAVLPAVIFNGIIVGFMITYFYIDTSGNFLKVLLYNMGTVALGELGVCYLLGLPLIYYLKKHKLFNL